MGWKKYWNSGAFNQLCDQLRKGESHCRNQGCLTAIFFTNTSFCLGSIITFFNWFVVSNPAVGGILQRGSDHSVSPIGKANDYLQKYALDCTAFLPKW